MKRKIGILFDLDGVLVDSEGEYSIFWGGMGRRYNLQSTFASDIKGTTLQEILLNFPEADRQGIKDELYQFEANMEYHWIPGAKEFVDELTEAGIPMAIVTSSDDAKMEKLYAKHPNLRKAITKVVTGDMVTKSKPDPEGYLLGARLIGVPIEDCFVFEDSMQGLEAGRRSGATVIGLATTNPREKVEKLAHKTISDFVGFTIKDLER